MSQRHAPKALQDVAMKAIQDPSVHMMAEAFAPTKRVSEKTDQYFIYNVDQQFRINPTIRANRSPAKRIENSKLSTTSYLLKRHSIATEVSTEDMKTADPAVNPEVDALQELSDHMLRERDNEAARTFFTSTSFGTNLVTLSSNAWDLDTTTSVPIDDADTAINGVMQSTGQIVNNMSIGKLTFDVLKDHTDILDRIKWSERGIITEDLLSTVLNVGSLHVGKGVKRTTEEGISATTSFIYDTKALFYYNTPNVRGKIANMGVTFSGLFGDTKPLVKRWFDNNIDATVIELDWMYDLKLVQSLSGYMFAATN